MEKGILIIQAAGHHEKNWNYRECLCMKRAFDKLNIPCGIWGKGFETYNTPFAEMVKDYSTILVLENYEMDWIPKFDTIPSDILKVFWSIDGHMVLDKHKKFVTDHGIQVVLNSNIDCVGAFHEMKVKSEWFPNAYDDSLMFPIESIHKDFGLGFCGSEGHGIRDAAVALLGEKFGIRKDIFVIGDDMVRAVNSYLIHFNFNINKDINYRTFETCGCGTLLLTNFTNGLATLFEIGAEIIEYNGEEDLLRKCHYYLSHPEEAFAIAEAGHKRAKANHTYFERARKFMEIISAPVAPVLPELTGSQVPKKLQLQDEPVVEPIVVPETNVAVEPIVEIIEEKKNDKPNTYEGITY